MGYHRGTRSASSESCGHEIGLLTQEIKKLKKEAKILLDHDEIHEIVAVKLREHSGAFDFLDQTFMELLTEIIIDAIDESQELKAK